MAAYGGSFSRAAFGLLEARRVPLHASPEPAPESVAAFVRAAEGLVPWSGAPGLLDAALGLPADTASPRVWTSGTMRYDLADGRPRLVAIAVPQVDPLRLSRAGPRPPWSDVHRGRYAWGGEPVAVDGLLRFGAARFLSRLEPLDTTPARTGVERAPGRVRFVPRPVELGVVGPDESAVGERTPGVPLRNWRRRLLLAWALQAPPLMNDRTSVADRVLYWRDVPSRLARLYRFAAFDAPQPVVVNDRLTWVADGYLTSSRFPMAERLRWRGEEINYLAAVYVVTVDAVSGETQLYLRPPAPPIARAVARAERVDPLPADSMPASLRARLGYPAALFAAQVLMLARRGEDSVGGPGWSLADRDTAGGGEIGAVRPATAVLSLEGAPEPWTLAPLVDAVGNRLVAIVAGAVAPNGAPRLRVFTIHGGAFPTPAAAAGRLAAATAGVATGQAVVRRAPVHVLPAGGTLAYAQVLFATPGPALEAMHVEGVALLAGTRLGFGADPSASVAALLRGGFVVPAGASQALLDQVRDAFAALDSARQRGDWAAFGRAYDMLRRLLLEPLAPRP